MKTHIIFAIFTLFLFTACASKEGRSLSSTDETRQEQLEYSHVNGSASRDFGRQ
jgi:hypothetical protein